jgi:hypothetical protein
MQHWRALRLLLPAITVLLVLFIYIGVALAAPVVLLLRLLGFRQR